MVAQFVCLERRGRRRAHPTFSSRTYDIERSLFGVGGLIPDAHGHSGALQHHRKHQVEVQIGEAGVCHCGSMGLREGLIFTTATPALGTSLEPAMAQMHKLSLAWSIFFNIKFTMHDIEEPSWVPSGTVLLDTSKRYIRLVVSKA